MMKDKDAVPGHADFRPEAGCAWFWREQGGGPQGRWHCRGSAGGAGAGNRGEGGDGGELFGWAGEQKEAERQEVKGR